MRTPLRENAWYKARLVQNRKLGPLEDSIAAQLQQDLQDVKDNAQGIVAKAIKRGWIKHNEKPTTTPTN